MSYAARYRAEGGSTGASEGAPLPAHCLTGALIRAKTLSRRHFVHKVRANGADALTGEAARTGPYLAA
ncbi:jg11113 [Pararge aegeria aegeria]|uniref:Jg11113 protein n=1 Tax=Pararge aegeria aegeria TaxID=348720 RepID=A0A8S4SLC8_9NEOP|nr:jg11113 [Pararge aegeria aegeria]